LGRTVDKLAINWQNFARIKLQLKLALRIRPLVTVMKLKL